jgi:hypothetical protein
MVLLGGICPWICYYRQMDLASVVTIQNPKGFNHDSSPGMPPGEERDIDSSQP